jgi:hypothetical protein
VIFPHELLGISFGGLDLCRKFCGTENLESFRLKTINDAQSQGDFRTTIVRSSSFRANEQVVDAVDSDVANSAWRKIPAFPGAA